MMTMGKEESEEIKNRISSPEFKIIEEFHFANLL